MRPAAGRFGIVAALLVVSCGPDGAQVGDVAEPPAEPMSDPLVVIDDLAFEGGAVTVTEGTVVTWSWEDAPVQHDVTFADGDGSALQADGTWSRTFEQTGTYAYWCEPHPFMRGVVEVVEAS